MIHEILTSDVEFARGMMNSSHSDVEILAYLTSRGIPAAKATELLADLRHGRNPIAQMPVGPSGGSSLAADRPRKAVAEAHQRSDSPRGRSQRGKHKRAGIAWWFVILVIIFVWAFGYALLNMGTDASRDVIDKSKHELPPPPGK